MNNIGKASSTILKIFLISILVLSISTYSANAKTDRNSQAFIGIYPQDLDDAMYEAMGLEEEGILVQDVVKDGPAEKAGLKTGDVLIKVDGKRMSSAKRLGKVVRFHEVGDVVPVEYWRKGKMETVKVTLGENEENNRIFYQVDDDDIHYFSDKDQYLFRKDFESKSKVWLGVMVEPLNDQLAEFFGAKKNKGLLVKEVIEDTPAEKYKLKAGDVIYKVKDKTIEEIGDIGEALSDNKEGDKVKIKVIRKKKKKEIELVLANRPQKEVKEIHTFVDMDINDKIHSALDNIEWEKFHLNKNDLKDDLEDLRDELEELRTRVKKLEK